MPRPPHYRPIITEDEALIALPRIIPLTKPTPIPLPSIFDEPSYCFKINKDWAGHFIGAILITLNQPDVWKTDETHDVEWARLQVIEWVAKLLTENDCMPCCDDLVEQLTTLIEINNTMLTNITTIVTNLTTVINNQVIEIDNSETVIEQNETEILNNYLTNWNQFVYHNEQMQIFNTMIYDGTPQSISPNLPPESNFGTDEDALCLALKNHFNAMMYIWNSGTVLTAIGAGLAASVAIAVGAALAPVTFGGSVAIGLGIAANLLIGVSGLVFNDIINNPEAQRKVLCCLFDTLKDSPITFDAWKNMGDGCTFPDEPNAEVLLDMFRQAAQVEANYQAFLRLLGQGQGQGNAQDCACDCEDDISLQDFSGTGCVITPMGNCVYRFTQATITETTSPPEGRRYFSFRDEFLRCLKIEFAPEPYPLATAGGCTTIGCCGQADYNGDNFGGGFAPTTLISVNWWVGGNNTDPQYYKITLQDMGECP